MPTTANDPKQSFTSKEQPPEGGYSIRGYLGRHRLGPGSLYKTFAYE
jgi:hypothetical protein